MIKVANLRVIPKVCISYLFLMKRALRNPQGCGMSMRPMTRQCGFFKLYNDPCCKITNVVLWLDTCSIHDSGIKNILGHMVTLHGKKWHTV